MPGAPVTVLMSDSVAASAGSAGLALEVRQAQCHPGQPELRLAVNVTVTVTRDLICILDSDDANNRGRDRLLVNSKFAPYTPIQYTC